MKTLKMYIFKNKKHKYFINIVLFLTLFFIFYQYILIMRVSN